MIRILNSDQTPEPEGVKPTILSEIHEQKLYLHRQRQAGVFRCHRIKPESGNIKIKIGPNEF
jgi:hypothetical protein